MGKRGLFVGLVTLDLIYLATSPPHSNQKIVASNYTLAAGGPATNAAVTFSYLGDRATLVGVAGNHPIGSIVKSDLASYGVTIADLDPTCSTPPPVSSIIVTESTGDRAIVSLNAGKSQIASDRIPPDILSRILLETDIVLIDGHQIAVGLEIAKKANALHVPIVVDGGSWKAGFEDVLALADYAVCSSNFLPPNCNTNEDVFTYATSLGIQHIAITAGAKPIQSVSRGKFGLVDVPVIRARDTLGAGDIFHGAFCHHILQSDFADALHGAASVASHSCQFFGTRQWMR